MEFGILGPLVIRDETGTRTVSAAKQRVVLAVLLLRTGHVVPMETLADVLWDGRPPSSALPSLRNYVMRLRRSLGTAGARILSRDGGYLVDIAEDEFDYLRFNRLRKEGASAFDRGDFEQASFALALALDQWRGPALSDVVSDVVQRDECPRLTADRLDALELKLRAECAMGRYNTSLSELRQFASAHPERESLWEHLILALLQNGRRTEADAAYQHICRVLEAEFGVLPGARLRQLYQSLTTAKAAGGANGASGAGGAGGAGRRPRRDQAGPPRDTTPFQIPADLADFTGREKEVAAAEALLGAPSPRGGRVMVLTGRAGIGKSALAIHVAHTVRESYPDGVLYAELQTDGGERVTSEQALASLLEACELDPRAGPGGLDGRRALLRSYLADRRVLLVLDGVVDSAQIRPLLPSTPESAALITSRLRLDELAGALHLELLPFSPAESAQLIGKIVGRARIAAEPQPMRELLLACGDLPLALRIIGSRLAARPAWSVRSLADRLADRDRRLDELKAGQLDVRAGLAGGYRSLPTPAAAALHRLAALDRQPLSVRDAAALLGVPQSSAEQMLECLVDHRFLASAREGSYRFPVLVREFALEQARSCTYSMLGDGSDTVRAGP